MRVLLSLGLHSNSGILHGTTRLIVSHQLPLLERGLPDAGVAGADRLYNMQGGRLVDYIHHHDDEVAASDVVVIDDADRPQKLSLTRSESKQQSHLTPKSSSSRSRKNVSDPHPTTHDDADDEAKANSSSNTNGKQQVETAHSPAPLAEGPDSNISKPSLEGSGGEEDASTALTVAENRERGTVY